MKPWMLLLFQFFIFGQLYSAKSSSSSKEFEIGQTKMAKIGNGKNKTWRNFQWANLAKIVKKSKSDFWKIHQTWQAKICCKFVLEAVRNGQCDRIWWNFATITKSLANFHTILIVVNGKLLKKYSGHLALPVLMGFTSSYKVLFRKTVLQWVTQNQFTSFHCKVLPIKSNAFFFKILCSEQILLRLNHHLWHVYYHNSHANGDI